MLEPLSLAEADQQFTLVISMFLNTVRTQLAMEGIEVSVPHVPPDEAILSARRGAPATRNPDVSYVDDISVLADKAINTLRRTVLVLRRVFRQFRLPPSFSSGKTEALADAFGPGASAPRMALWNTHACSVECVDEHGSTTIRLYRTCVHLGSIVSAPEVLVRTSAANRAYSCQEHRTDALQSFPAPLADRDGRGLP